MSTPGNQAMLVVGFLLFMALCGFLCLLTDSDQDDSHLAQPLIRPLRPWQHGLAISGTAMSSVSLLGITGLVALTGGDGMTLLLGMVLSMVLLALVLAEPLRRAGHRTVSDALARRMPQRSVRVALALVTLLVCLCFLVLQLATVGTMTAFLIGLPGDGPKTACIVMIGVLMVSLAVTGGLRGTALIQIVKVVILLLTMGAVVAIILHRADWNPERLLGGAASRSGLGDAFLGFGVQYGPGALGIAERLGTAAGLPLAIACLPQVTMRVLAVPSPRATRSAMRWAVAQMLLISALLAVIGLGAAAVMGANALVTADPTGSSSILVLSHALDPDGFLLSAVSCAVFLAALATITDVTLAAAGAVGHDLYAQVMHGGEVSRARVMTFARWSAAVIGGLAVVLAAFASSWPLLVLSALGVALSSSALGPALVYGLLWPRFTSQGALWCLYGSTVLSLALTAVSPLISGSASAVFPDLDFHLIPLTVPAVVTLPAGFALGWLGSILPRRKAAAAAQRFEELTQAEFAGVDAD
ncbi:cation acetate symporter [Streptomyces sp. NPDC056002]|uniref:sodium/solute symporter n=1 Tax=Streptomyces sp. NPDC056002 TaxID=3345675 RepID=UPI0035E0BA8B